MKKIWIPIILSICYGCASMKNTNTAREILYIGTASESGIHVYEFERGKLSFTPLQTVSAVKPTFLAIHPGKGFLYSVNRVSLAPGKDWGSVAAWAVDAQSGELTLLNEQSTHGKDPNHISLDQTGEWAFVTNFRGDNIAVFPILGDGTLGEASDVKDHTETAQDGTGITPHPHSIMPSPGNHYFYVQNLGTDKIITYTLDRATGRLNHVNRDIAAPKGSGPRHALFSADGRYYYVAEELGSSISSYRYNAKTGELNFLQRLSTLPSGYTGATKVADIQLHPNGKFLYVSNRGHDSVAIYKVDPVSGHLGFIKTQPALGKHPRNILIDPKGQFLMLANEQSDKVVVFTLDEETGDITPTGVELNVPAPTFLYLLKLE